MKKLLIFVALLMLVSCGEDSESGASSKNTLPTPLYKTINV